MRALRDVFRQPHLTMTFVDGYFITKHSSPKELEEGVSHSDAREREATFFESTSPWSHKMELRSRMGTPNLTRELSNLLGAVISQSYVISSRRHVTCLRLH